MRIVICSVCEKEWQLRSGMAFESLGRHKRSEHKEAEVAQAAQEGNFNGKRNQRQPEKPTLCG